MTLRYSHSVVFCRHIELIKKLFAEGWLVQGVHGHLKETDEEFTMSLNTFRKFLREYKISKREIKKNGPDRAEDTAFFDSGSVTPHQNENSDKAEIPLAESTEPPQTRTTIPMVTKSDEVPRMLDVIDQSLAVPATHAEFMRLRKKKEINGEGK